jgi:hypothetical protein
MTTVFFFFSCCFLKVVNVRMYAHLYSFGFTNSISMCVNRCFLRRLPAITFAFELQTTRRLNIMLLEGIKSPVSLAKSLMRRLCI